MTRLRSLFLFLVGHLACVCGVNAQVLTDAQVDAIETAVAETGGELASLRAFQADIDLPTGLTREQADAVLTELFGAYRAGIVASGSAQHSALGDLPPTMAAFRRERGDDATPAPRSMRLREFEMPFNLVRREPSGVPEAGRPMFICTHGGGGNGGVDGPHAWDVNSREWRIQTRFAIRRYAPEGLYFVPRMADDRRGRWRHAHHQDQFELAVRHGILFWGIDPNRVYKLGISQGGFASTILGAFMPDLFAGINPMAAGVGLGNPVENLRNLPCFTSVGENDTMFNRVGHAIAWHERLDELQAEDPGGYAHHRLDLQAGRGHGIDYSPGAPWIARRTRDPHPEVVVWTSKPLNGRRRESMYWVELTGEALRGTIELAASVDRDENSVRLTARQAGGANAEPNTDPDASAGRVPLAGAQIGILLNDALLDLDREVTIMCNGERVFAGKVVRDAGTQLETLVRRGDPNFAFPVRVLITLDERPAGGAPTIERARD